VTIKKSTLFGLLTIFFWSPIPFLYLGHFDFLAGHPLAIYAVVLFLGGLSAASMTLLITLRKRMSEKTARVYMFLFALAFVGAYQFSGLAPNWNCFGKKLYVATANAAGQNCTTTCTNNKKKPCSGWSTCWDKFASCDASGKDQDGRPCQGCCFSCDVVCEPDPSSDQPPTITVNVSCSQNGNNGWCTGTETLNLTASDPQGYTLTISGNIGEMPFTCASGNTCSQPLPDGNGTINYAVTASQSGMSANGSTTWKRDTAAPVVTPNVPAPTGSNGWFKTAPVAISVSGSDTLSGLASAQVSVNGGAWQSNASLSSDGVYTLNFRSVDNAGNIATTSRTVSVDATVPVVSFNVSGTLGTSGWYVSQAIVSASATDSLSGVNTILISDNGGTGKPSSVTLNNGVHVLTITATDKAGNSKSIFQTVNVDTSGPIITPSSIGTSGTNGWYISAVDLSAAASDALSGVQGSIEVSLDNGTSWTSLPVNLTDGIHPLVLRAYDNAGNLSTSLVLLKVDTTTPTFDISTIGTKGNAFWYLSAITTNITSDDTLSGVDRVEYNQNGAGWQTGTSVTSIDGINAIAIRVYDVAGNMASGSVTVRVDTVAPLITPSISGTSGLNGWLVSPGTASATINDATSGVNGESEVSFDGGSTWQSAPVLLNDGVYSMTFRAFDIAGNEGMASLSASIDTTSPTMNFVFTGTLGANGWYVSDVKVSANASDVLSGVDEVEVIANGGRWSSSVMLSDGAYMLDGYAIDKAGNIKTISDALRIDTSLPSSNYTSHTDNSLVSGVVHLAGLSSDSNGLQSMEISLDGGVTWQTTTLSSNVWSYDWNSTSVPNGTYTVYVRATDMAGNQENPVPLVLVVDNFPPHVKITDFWWIWDSGEYKVSENTFAIREITVKISDPKNRWSPVKLTYDPDKTSSEVTWDRRFSGGVIAPMGNYWAEIIACDVYGNCASDKGQIKIPILASVPPAATPTEVISSPPPTVTALVPTEIVVATPSATSMPAQVISEHPTPKKSGLISRPHWVVLILSLLVLLFGILYVLDPRPKALRSLAQSINQFNKE